MSAIPVERDPEAVTWHRNPPAPTRYHPYADLLPLMDDDGYRALRKDVRENGVREPIVMYEGQILDGRHRYLAARDEGVPYPIVEYEGEDPLGYVISLNLHRRHLSDSQRAMVASKMAKLPAHRPSSRNDAELRSSDAAALMSVSRRSVMHASAVRQHGAPSLISAVETGQVSVSAAAEVARLPEAEQVEIVGQGPMAVKAAASRARQKPATPIPPRPRQTVSDETLWLWGRLGDLEKGGYFTRDHARLLAGATDEMRADMRRLIPLTVAFLTELEKSL